MNTFIYIDNYSLLVVSEKSGMVRLTCPFLVCRLYHHEDEYILGEFALVTEVRESKEHKLEYCIRGIFYPYQMYVVPKDD